MPFFFTNNFIIHKNKQFEQSGSNKGQQIKQVNFLVIDGLTDHLKSHFTPSRVFGR